MSTRLNWIAHSLLMRMKIHGKLFQHLFFFADQLGMKFVAEGIESTQQLQLLETYRCDMVKCMVIQNLFD